MTHRLLDAIRRPLPLVAVLVALAWLWTACDESTSRRGSSDDDDDGAGGHAGGGATGGNATGGTSSGGNATGGTSSGGSGTGGEPGPVIASCQLACGGVNDCDQGSAPYDQDNYTCDEGYCHYQGCNSDSECQVLGSYLCRDGGYGMNLCQASCTTTANCDLGSAPYDADNYTCTNDVCIYTGCNSDGECQVLGNYICRDAGYGINLCTQACDSVDDCNLGTPPYDQDNYECTGGACVYTGCNSDAECQYLGNYICR